MFSIVGFWVCFLIIGYIYVGYPTIVFLLSFTLNRKVSKSSIQPYVTIITAAFNEERDIEHTILNKLSQKYPEDRLNIIVISDGSTDRTDAIVQEIMNRYEGRIILLRQEPRQGKTQALNKAVNHALSEILVFSDANSIYSPDAVQCLVQSFADPAVGYVTGRMSYTNPEATGIGEGSGVYMNYENLLRAIETQLGSVVGVDGGIDAIRKDLYIPMRADQLPDFVLPLSVIEQGKRVVYEPDALLYEPALSNANDEFRMRVRVALRAFHALYDKRRLLNPLRYGVFSWQLLSHKVLRYIAFIPFVLIFLFNLTLLDFNRFYYWFLIIQIIAYTVAVLSHFLKKLPLWTGKILIPYYFVILNTACAVAFWKFLKGDKMVIWRPRSG